MIESCELTFDPIPVNHVVPRLLHGGRDQVVLPSHTVGFHDLPGTPFGGAPVEHFTLLDKRIHGSDRLFDGRFWIRTVTIVQIEVVDPEAFEGCVAGF